MTEPPAVESSSSTLPPTSPSSQLSNTTKELFNIWTQKCASRRSLNGANRLKDEACSFFQSLSTGVTIKTADNQILQTKASHQHALATLLQAFQSIWAPDNITNDGNSNGNNDNVKISNLIPRYHALYCLTGALQGCNNSSSSISIAMLNLIGGFLLPHIGPLSINSQTDIGNNELDDLDEKVRDAALSALSTLVLCYVERPPPQQEQPKQQPLQEQQEQEPQHDQEQQDDQEVKEQDQRQQNEQEQDQQKQQTDITNPLDEIISIRLKFAHSGVEYRCASPSDEGDNNNKYDYQPQEYNDHGQIIHKPIGYGLSSLPRAQRSLCFELVQAAVKAVGNDLQEVNETNKLRTSSTLVNFAKFVPTLLHGESDPRCLLQLLTLFADLLQLWKPAFVNSNATNVFPVGDYFDAIAPYYPIQFTPPPNNVHGITKGHLQQAILRIMACTAYDYDCNKTGQDGMLTLSVGIVLDTIMPPPEDGPATLTEQYECLSDLAYILLDANDGTNTKLNIEMLEDRTLRNISDTLYAVHSQVSLIVASKQGTEEATYAKKVADACRDLVSRLAVACEQASNNRLWNVFVRDMLQSLSDRISSTATASADARTAMAYIACLCACGCLRTLQSCLENGLSPLLNQLLQGMHDDNDLTAAMFGIGALFSSTRVALDKMNVTVHPHPLQSYTVPTIEKICSFCMLDSTAPPVRAAAVQAIESLMLAAPANQAGPDQITKLCQLVQTMTDILLDDYVEELTMEQKEWIQTCADVLGRLIGRTFSDGASENKSILLYQNDTLRKFIHDNILPSFIASITSKKSSSIRYDRKSMAIASLASEEISQRLAFVLLKMLSKDNIESNGCLDKGSLEAVHFFSLNGGSSVAKALQDGNENGISLLTVIDSLYKFKGEKKRQNSETRFRTSLLELPPTLEDITAVEDKLKSAYEAVPLLLPIYRNYVSPPHLATLVRRASDSMPPLTAEDTVKIAVLLPFLSVALRNAQGKGMGEHYKQIQQFASTMVPDLLEFCMAPDLNLKAQFFAAECLHVILSTYLTDEDECPVLKLTRETLFPSLRASLQAAESNKQSSKAKNQQQNVPINFQQLEKDVLDKIMLCGVLGSAAVLRGGFESSQTADTFATFLIDLACCSKADDLISNEVSPIIDLTLLDRPNRFVSQALNVAAASAFGSIMSGFGGSALWKQRLALMAVRRMKAGETLPYPGSLNTACHIISSCELSSLGSSNLDYLADFVMQGLSSRALLQINTLPAFAGMATPMTVEVKKLMLVAVLKLLSANQETLIQHLYSVVVGTLRLYASLNATEGSATACKLLALQILVAVTNVDRAKDLKLMLKPAIVSILGAAVNDQSCLIRSAAVEVRNCWFVIA